MIRNLDRWLRVNKHVKPLEKRGRILTCAFVSAEKKLPLLVIKGKSCNVGNITRTIYLILKQKNPYRFSCLHAVFFE